MSTVLKVIAIVVAAGSGLAGVLGQTRDRDTGKLKALGWWSAGLVCLAAIVALGLAWHEYVDSRARQQCESEMDRVVHAVLGGTIPFRNLKMVAEFEPGTVLPKDWDAESFRMQAWIMRAKRQSEMRMLLTRASHKYRSVLQLEGESQRASVPLFESNCIDGPVGVWAGTTCWIRVRKVDVVRDFNDPHTREGLFVYWPYEKFSDFYDTELHAELTGFYSVKVRTLQLMLNDAHVITIPLADGLLPSGTKGVGGKIPDLFSAVVTATTTQSLSSGK